MTKLSGPMLPPLNGGPPRQVVVLLHGYGSDGSDLIALAMHWRELLSDALFVSPNAPETTEDNPSGYQWFSIDYEQRHKSWQSGPPLARTVLTEFLEALWVQTRLGTKNTILVGFSQGAMMALHVGLSLPEPVLGIIAFSGALVLPETDAGASARPPICLVHGDQDTIVDPKLSRLAAETLRARGHQVNYHVSTGAGHTVSSDGLGFASAFLAAISTRL